MITITYGQLGWLIAAWMISVFLAAFFKAFIAAVRREMDNDER